MHGNLSAEEHKQIVTYPTVDSNVAFQTYLDECQQFIRSRRTDLLSPNLDPKLVVFSNAPYEMQPENYSGQSAQAALLLHGLFDCPFSLKDIGYHLQAHGIYSRSILLPGHGTMAADLLHVSYQDWLHAAKCAIDSLAKVAKKIYLIGYSTGAAISVYHALNDERIAGIILLAPAIKIKAPVNFMVCWHRLLKIFAKNESAWIYKEDETDYTKYHSVPFNPAIQIGKLTQVNARLTKYNSLKQPMLMILSKEDETISSSSATSFFLQQSNPNSRLLYYDANKQSFADKRVVAKTGYYPKLNILHFSHICLPYSPQNLHYGQYGDYPGASRISNQHLYYGAYNRLEVDFFSLLHKLRIVKYKRRELTYNPDFDFMADMIVDFITAN